MRQLLIIVFVLITSALFAQKEPTYISVNVQNVIYSLDFDQAREKIKAFVKENNIKIQNQQERKREITLSFNLSEEQYKKYEVLIAGMGYSAVNKVSTVNNTNRVKEIKLELTYLKKKKESYTLLLNKLKENSKNYLSFWRERQQIEQQIFNKEKQLFAYDNKENAYIISFRLLDEARNTQSKGVSFVNMPGIEYSFLSIESPKAGLSPNDYQGIFLKYLFTKGKSFGQIGVFKNNEVADADSTTFSELFILGFGQDFYSRHLGRGARKFLNLYSGYTIGGALATGKKSSETIFYLSPTVGLELFKSKYILVDTKASYFIPFKENRNLRGFAFSASFNFMF